jgi:hypothetical protein
MNELNHIVMENRTGDLQRFFDPKLKDKEKANLTIKQWQELLLLAYVQDIHDREFEEYLNINFISRLNEDKYKNMSLLEVISVIKKDKEKNKFQKIGNKVAIKKLTKDSKRRMVFMLSNTTANWNTMVTLTYPRVFPKSGGLAKKHLNNFFVNMKNRFGKDTKYF